MEIGQMAKQRPDTRARSGRSACRARLFHYYGFREYEPALLSFSARSSFSLTTRWRCSLSPYVHRRQGKWDRTLDELKRSIDQDPRDAVSHRQPCRDLCLSAHVERSRRHCPACPDYRPTRGHRMRMLLLSSLNRTGNAQEPLRLLATFPPDDLLLPNTGMFDMVIGTRGQTFVLGRDFNAALKACETGTVARTNEWQRFAAKAGIRVLAGDVPGAHADAEKARELLETRLREQPNDFRSHESIKLGLSRAGPQGGCHQHRPADTRSSATRERRGAWFRKPGSLGRDSGADRCATEAVQNLKKLLSIPAGETVSIARLKIDPVWDPIRNDPGFQELLTANGSRAGTPGNRTFQMFQHVTVLVSFIFAIALMHVFSSASQLLLARRCAFQRCLRCR